MKNNHRTLLLACAFAVVLCPTQAPSQTGKPPQSGRAVQAAKPAWQSDWQAFVTAHNACIQDPKCSRAQFEDKVVTWTGLAKAVDLAKPSVVMEMDGPPITDSAGTKVEILIFVINPTASEKEKWTNIAAGTRVRFSTKLVSGLIGSITGFMPLAGKAAVMLFTEGAELQSVVPK